MTTLRTLSLLTALFACTQAHAQYSYGPSASSASFDGSWMDQNGVEWTITKRYGGYDLRETTGGPHHSTSVSANKLSFQYRSPSYGTYAAELTMHADGAVLTGFIDFGSSKKLLMMVQKDRFQPLPASMVSTKLGGHWHDSYGTFELDMEQEYQANTLVTGRLTYRGTTYNVYGTVSIVWGSEVLNLELHHNGHKDGDLTLTAKTGSYGSELVGEAKFKFGGSVSVTLTP